MIRNLRTFCTRKFARRTRKRHAGEVRCRVCRHAKRAVIESDAASVPFSEVATKYAVSEIALERHLEMHDRASYTALIDEACPDTQRSREGQAA